VFCASIVNVILEWSQRELASVKSVQLTTSASDPILSQAADVDEAAVKQLLDQQERDVRRQLQRYLSSTHQQLVEKRRIEERELEFRGFRQAEERYRNEREDLLRRNERLTQEFQHLQQQNNELLLQVRSYKEREDIVIEKARRRECDLHNQVERLRSQLGKSAEGAQGSLGDDESAGVGSPRRRLTFFNKN
jgi:hypothetical protein